MTTSSARRIAALLLSTAAVMVTLQASLVSAQTVSCTAAVMDGCGPAYQSCLTAAASTPDPKAAYCDCVKKNYVCAGNCVCTSGAYPDIWQPACVTNCGAGVDCKAAVCSGSSSTTGTSSPPTTSSGKTSAGMSVVHAMIPSVLVALIAAAVASF